MFTLNGIFIGTEGEGGPSGEDVESKKTVLSLVESFPVKVVGEWRESAAAIGHKVHQARPPTAVTKSSSE